MIFFQAFCSDGLSLGRLFALCTVLAMSRLNLEAGSVAIPVGPPVKISPGPGNSDPILANLAAVMNDHYVQPYYPGTTPFPVNYLGKVYLQTNTYSPGNLVINPSDDRVMCVQMGQNLLWDFSGTFNTFATWVGTNTFASSTDGGYSWSYGPPIEQIIPLGGMLSQAINSSFGFGPGFYIQYGHNGQLYASGHCFADMRPNFPNTVPMSGFLFTSSFDNGTTWIPSDIVYSRPVDWAFQNSTYNVGIGFGEFFTTVDPVSNNLIHASAVSTLYPSQVVGVLYYFISKDGGKNFSVPVAIYTLINDPVWVDQYLNPSFPTVTGGMVFQTSPPLVYDRNIILLPISREYPKVGVTNWTGNADDTSYDFGVVRSENCGKTWSNVAYVTSQVSKAFQIHDPGYLNPYANPNGGLGANGESPLPTIISPFTGRIYLNFPLGNPAYVSTPPNVDNIWNNPYIATSSSSDKGLTWSTPVRINQTPTNTTYVGAQQAFDATAIMTFDGYYVVAYCDFRNWTGFPGENVQTQPLQTDVWLAVYKETDDPVGGSTGIGLDFIEELRVTPCSFNARIMSQSTNYIYGQGSPYFTGTAQGLRMAVNKNNELFVLFCINHENSNSNIQKQVAVKGMYTDTNNRSNIFMQRYQFPKPCK